MCHCVCFSRDDILNKRLENYYVVDNDMIAVSKDNLFVADPYIYIALGTVKPNLHEHCE